MTFNDLLSMSMDEAIQWIICNQHKYDIVPKRPYDDTIKKLIDDLSKELVVVCR